MVYSSFITLFLSSKGRGLVFSNQILGNIVVYSSFITLFLSGKGRGLVFLNQI